MEEIVRRPNPTKGTRPPLPTDREGFREGRGCDWRGVRTREDPKPDKGEPDPHSQRTERDEKV